MADNRKITLNKSQIDSIFDELSKQIKLDMGEMNTQIKEQIKIEKETIKNKLTLEDKVAAIDALQAKIKLIFESGDQTMQATIKKSLDAAIPHPSKEYYKLANFKKDGQASSKDKKTKKVSFEPMRSNKP